MFSTSMNGVSRKMHETNDDVRSMVCCVQLHISRIVSCDTDLYNIVHVCIIDCHCVYFAIAIKLSRFSLQMAKPT